ncbi:acyl carrier protein [Micromonospora sp. BRA006-A]|nr:acyl carrier protein [Micromonospora sp. BRA006-A]
MCGGIGLCRRSRRCVRRVCSPTSPKHSPHRPRRRRRADRGAASALRERLAAASGSERDRILLDLVRGTAALVLGHATPSGIRPPAASSNWASTRSPQSSCATG